MKTKTKSRGVSKNSTLTKASKPVTRKEVLGSPKIEKKLTSNPKPKKEVIGEPKPKKKLIEGFHDLESETRIQVWADDFTNAMLYDLKIGRWNPMYDYLEHSGRYFRFAEGIDEELAQRVSTAVVENLQRKIKV